MAILLTTRAQDVALLQIKEIAKLNPPGTYFKLLEVMDLPAAYTKGADAMGTSQSRFLRKTVSFDVTSFNQVVRQIEALAKAGADVNPEDFYPPVRKYRGKSQDLPMVDAALRADLVDYLRLRIEKAEMLKPSLPSFYYPERRGPLSKHSTRAYGRDTPGLGWHRNGKLTQRAPFVNYKRDSQAEKVCQSSSKNCWAR